MAYGARTQPKGATSPIMRRGSGGERQNYRFTHRGVVHDRPAPTRSNRWVGYETKSTSKAGTKAPSSRTAQVSRSAVRLGTGLVIGGRYVVPVIGWSWFAHDLIYEKPLHEKVFDLFEDTGPRVPNPNWNVPVMMYDFYKQNQPYISTAAIWAASYE